MISSEVGIVEWLKRIWSNNHKLVAPTNHDRPLWDIDGWGEETRLLTAFDDMVIGAAFIASDGHFLRVNECLCKMLGYSAKEFSENKVQAILDKAEPDDWNHICSMVSK